MHGCGQVMDGIPMNAAYQHTGQWQISLVLGVIVMGGEQGFLLSEEPCRRFQTSIWQMRKYIRSRQPPSSDVEMCLDSAARLYVHVAEGRVGVCGCSDCQTARLVTPGHSFNASGVAGRSLNIKGTRLANQTPFPLTPQPLLVSSRIRDIYGPSDLRCLRLRRSRK